MTALGISLIVSGLTLVGASIVFLMFTGREPSSSQETFEESLERIRFLAAPDGRCVPLAEGVKHPDMFGQIVKESMDNFVRQNPRPSPQPREQRPEAFMDHLAQQKRPPR